MPSRPQRGQGQWAMGHHEPLNASERMKKDDDGLHVRERILTRYAHLGFDAIDPADLRGRFRWWGLYTHYVERVLRNYLADRADGEQFAAWARRASESLLT